MEGCYLSKEQILTITHNLETLYQEAFVERMTQFNAESRARLTAARNHIHIVLEEGCKKGG